MDVSNMKEVCLLHTSPIPYCLITESLHPVWRRCHCNESSHRHDFFSKRAFGPVRDPMYPTFLLQVCNDTKDFCGFVGKDREQTGDMLWARSWDCEATAWAKVTAEWKARRLWHPLWRFVPGNECSLEAFLKRVAILTRSTDEEILDIVRIWRPLSRELKAGLKDLEVEDLDLECAEDMREFLRKALEFLEDDSTIYESGTWESGHEADGEACTGAENRDVDIDTEEGRDAENEMLDDPVFGKHDTVQGRTPPVICKAEAGSSEEAIVPLWRSSKASAGQDVDEKDELRGTLRQSSDSQSRGIKRSREKEVDKYDKDDISRRLNGLDIRPSKMARRHLMIREGGSGTRECRSSSVGARRGAISCPENRLQEALARLEIAAAAEEDEEEL
ncbi:hypothetical protein LIA77_08187 [Sarocladium implicatum]|nr:hypothetical protein LIA77_08187 [Sarocladium implicatum]